MQCECKHVSMTETIVAIEDKFLIGVSAFSVESLSLLR